MALSELEVVFRLDQAVDAGMSKDQIYRLRDAGELETIGRGIYLQPGTLDPSIAPLLAATLRQPLATLCLTSALVHHGLSDEIPRHIDIAIPRGARPPAGFTHTAWHNFAPDTFAVGREEVKVAKLTMGIYSAERSIIDTLRLAHREGVDAANEALRRWLRKRGNSPASLLTMARDFPTVMPRLRHALEVLL